MAALSRDLCVRAPKASLHDHLDGGLRPATVIDLASEYGYKSLPTTDVDELSAWCRRTDADLEERLVVRASNALGRHPLAGRAIRTLGILRRDWKDL